MTIEEKIKGCLSRHTDWTSKRIAKSMRPSPSVAFVNEMRGGSSSGKPGREFISKVPTVITLADVRQRFDIPAAIKRELSRLDRGALLPEDELCRLTAGKDRNRFRRALDNNPQLPQQHRIKLRLDDSGDGKFFWGSATDIAEAKRIYEA
jgi:hypothetical protein